MAASQAIFVINLARRKDRRAEMNRQLSAIGWEAKFFPAIRPDGPGEFPSIGARGCFLSHLEVLKSTRGSGVGRVVILEDDSNFIERFAEHWKVAMAKLEKRDWDIFYPGHVLDNLPQGLSPLATTVSVKCAHFMVVNGPAIGLLIDELELILSRPAGHPIGGPMHVDGAYSTIRRQNPQLIAYAYSPALAYQRPSRTDIGHLSWIDRIDALAPVARAARKLKLQAASRWYRKTS